MNASKNMILLRVTHGSTKFIQRFQILFSMYFLFYFINTVNF